MFQPAAKIFVFEPFCDDSDQVASQADLGF